MGLTKEDIVAGLRQLGVAEGMVVMVHVSLSAFGTVEGGADTLIAALIEAVGDSGTLCMPAMASERPFDVASSPSTVGSVTERFRLWPGVKRSLHPTHSVCCLGPRAEELIAGHIDQPTALGPESPWGRLARIPGACVLLLGCDQDRNTLLHCAEEIVDAPYLSTIEREYLDAEGQIRTKVLAKFPGPHRDFIGLDSLFRDAGIMRVGRIGKAVCRLLEAGPALELAVAALRADPAAVLCNNPNCDDCVKQRAAIMRQRLAQESFVLSAVIDEMGLPLTEVSAAAGLVRDQGIDVVEFGPELSAALLLSEEDLGQVADKLRSAGVGVSMVTAVAGGDLGAAVASAVRVATALGAQMVKLPADWGQRAGQAEVAVLAERLVGEGHRLVVENASGTPADTKVACEGLLAAAAGLRLAFNPAHFAHVGEKPFLQTFYKGKLKHGMAQLYVTDGCRPGGPAYTLPGQGHGEVKELISILRCRSFDGYICLKMGDRRGLEEFRRHCKAFWRLMDTM